MKFKITSPSGQVLRIKGDHYPTDEELTQIFASVSPSKNTEETVSETIEEQAPTDQEFEDLYASISQTPNEPISKTSDVEESLADKAREISGSIAQGATFGWGDELAGVGGGIGNVIGGMLTGDFDISKNYQEGYQAERDKQRRLDEKFAQENPYTNLALQLAGGVGGAGLVSKGIGAATKTIGAIPGVAQAVQPVEQAVQTVSNLMPKTGIAGTLGKAAVGAAKGAASGFGYGALTGAGAAKEMEDIPEMAKEYAKTGATYGGAIGGAIPVAVDTLAPIAKGLGKGANYIKRALNIGNTREMEMLGGKENIIRAGFNARNPDGTIDYEKFRESVINGLPRETTEKISASASEIGRKSNKAASAYENAIKKYFDKKEGQLQASLNKIANKSADEVNNAVLQSQEKIGEITPSKEGLGRLYRSDPTEVGYVSEQLEAGVDKNFITPKNVTQYQEAAKEFSENFNKNTVENFKNIAKKLDTDTYNNLVRNADYTSLGPSNIDMTLPMVERDQKVINRLSNILQGKVDPSAEELVYLGQHINKVGSSKVLKSDTILKNFKADLNQIKESTSPKYKTLNTAMRGRNDALEGFNKITKDLDKTPTSELSRIAKANPNTKIGMSLSLDAEYLDAVKNSNMRRAKDVIKKTKEILGEEAGNALHKLDPQAKTISKLNEFLELSGLKPAGSSVAENIAVGAYASQRGAIISTVNATRNAIKQLSKSYSPKQIKNFEKFLTNDNYIAKLKILNKITDPLEKRSWGRMLNEYNNAAINAARNEIILNQANQQGEQ